MNPAMTITPPQWMREPALLNLMKLLNQGDLNALLVGGCVRDHLYGKDVHDIDIATSLTPDATMERLNSHGIKVIPTGLSHGTVTAIIHHHHFEITTLRHDHNQDGRHADVTFDAGWKDDAQRRDFTINALYATCDGSIYDPLGTGLNDLHNKTVRFIGDAERRIQEDALRILRFFRFYARFHDGEVNTESFSACKNLKHSINNLSDERVVDELYKTFDHYSAPKAFQAIKDADIFDLQNIDQLSTLINLQTQLNCIDLNTRYIQVGLDQRYIKNNKTISFFKNLEAFKQAWNGNINLALYRFERPIVLQGLLSLKAEGQNVTDIIVSGAMNNRTPQLPVTATDIMDHFKIGEGREVGKHLKRAENIWVNGDFSMKRQDILDKI